MRRQGLLAICFLISAVLLTGCRINGDTDSGILVSADETYETSGEDAGDYVLKDQKALYDEEDEEVITMYLTVGRGNEGEDTDHSSTFSFVSITGFVFGMAQTVVTPPRAAASPPVFNVSL